MTNYLDCPRTKRFRRESNEAQKNIEKFKIDTGKKKITITYLGKIS